MLLVTPLSTAAGLVPPGYPVNQEPGTSISVPPEEPQTVLLRRVVEGTYEAYLFGMASGPYHLHILLQANDKTVCEGQVEGMIEEGERWMVPIEVAMRGDRPSSCAIGDPEQVFEDPDIALVLRDSLLNRLPKMFFASAAPTSTPGRSPPRPLPGQRDLRPESLLRPPRPRRRRPPGQHPRPCSPQLLKRPTRP